jgi:hypothetical protein
MHHDNSPDNTDDATEMERDAARLLLALDAHVLTEDGEARAVERYARRLRFALDRVTELRCAPTDRRTPARLRFALDILENHLRQGAIFADRVVSRLPKRTAARLDLLPAEEPDEREQSSTGRAA